MTPDDLISVVLDAFPDGPTAPSSMSVKPHRYVSTACLHGEHAYCASTTRPDGAAKEPACCKFCGAPCECSECDHVPLTDTEVGNG